MSSSGERKLRPVTYMVWLESGGTHVLMLHDTDSDAQQEMLAWVGFSLAWVVVAEWAVSLCMTWWAYKKKKSFCASYVQPCSSYTKTLFSHERFSGICFFSHSWMYNQPGPFGEWDKSSLKENDCELLERIGISKHVLSAHVVYCVAFWSKFEGC